MICRAMFGCLAAWCGLFAVGAIAQAAGHVQLELYGDARSMGTALQEWNEALGRAGIRDVRIRSGDGSQQPKLDVQGGGASPLYVVTGVIVSRDEVALPGARFRRNDLGRMSAWLTDLAANGPVNGRPAKAAFGLSLEQFALVHDDLAATLSFSTQDMGRGQAVQRIAAGLKLRLPLDPALLRQLDAEKVGTDLLGLSSGTALAYILRPAGYCLAPQAAGTSAEYAIVKARPGLEIWPIGWPPKGTANKALPALYEFLNVNVQNVSAADALKAVAERLKAPVLIDLNALARHGLDPTKSMVSMPPGRTTYSLALRKLLFQAGLKYEVRVDEADAPFLWVSSVKPM